VLTSRCPTRPAAHRTRSNPPPVLVLPIVRVCTVVRLAGSALPVCSYPPEYCEFSTSITRCKEWLKGAHPNLFDRFWSDGACAHLPPRNFSLNFVQIFLILLSTPYLLLLCAEALQSKLGTLSLEKQQALEKDVAKKEAKAEAKADAALKKKMSSQVRFPPFIVPAQP
jgi:hypothetical protein